MSIQHLTSTARPIGSKSRQRGLSLVEVMIAMLLGVFLVGGVLQVFASSRQTYRMHDAVSRMQESGRMALEVISRDVRMADFWGCVTEVSQVTNNLNSAGAGYIDYTSSGIQGTEGAGTAADTLVLRGAINSGLGVEPPYGPQASANVSVAAGNDLEQDQIILVADCEAADIFQISNANPGTSGTVVHNTGSGSPGNYNATDPGCPGANAHCLSKIYGADAVVFGVQQITYSIGPGSEGHPALFRNGLELIDGIEDFQVLYGEDTDAIGAAGAGVANYYVPASSVVDMENVISIRFAVVTRSYEDNLTDGIAQTYNVLGNAVTAADERLRHVYSTTVNIRNRL